MLENTAQAIGVPSFDLQQAMQHLSAIDEKLAELIERWRRASLTRR
jgi:hypothetical protein